MGGRICVDLEKGDCDKFVHKSWSTCRGYGGEGLGDGRSELTFFSFPVRSRRELFSSVIMGIQGQHEFGTRRVGLFVSHGWFEQSLCIL